jgi:hypothetical protein
MIGVSAAVVAMTVADRTLRNRPPDGAESVKAGRSR